jgi:hypothetical protein
MISPRTLNKWRRDALKDQIDPGTLVDHKGPVYPVYDIKDILELNRRILLMTQELLDLHLIKK